ncbi:MAG: AraC family transcriptional regulator [Acinetobacter sp.]
MSKFIDSHKAALQQAGNLYLDTCSNLPNHHLNLCNPSDGQGYSELYDFDRLCVGKGQYWLNHPLQMSANRQTYSLGLTILLSGTHRLKNHQTNQEYEFHSPMIILRKGVLGLQTIYLQEHTQMSLISLDFDESLLKRLEPSSTDNDLIRFFLDRSSPAIQTIHIPCKDILHQAQYILNLPLAKNMVDLLHLEGATLELLSLLLQKTAEEESVARPIQKAISILETQFDQKITIRHLSKQVGMNECDLKRLFKQNTGQTIGHFLLKTRMKYAQSLLKQGVSIELVANQIGYSSAQYFKRIFEQHFGYIP